MSLYELMLKYFDLVCVERHSFINWSILQVIVQFCRLLLQFDFFYLWGQETFISKVMPLLWFGPGRNPYWKQEWMFVPIGSFPLTVSSCSARESLNLLFELGISKDLVSISYIISYNMNTSTTHHLHWHGPPSNTITHYDSIPIPLLTPLPSHHFKQHHLLGEHHVPETVLWVTTVLFTCLAPCDTD